MAPTDSECQGANCRWTAVFVRDKYPEWMRAMYCPGHKECSGQVPNSQVRQTTSSSEGMFTNGVSNNGDKVQQSAQLSGNTDNLQKRGNVYQVQPAFKWDNGIFTPSSNREGEVTNTPLPCQEEHRQAFSEEGGAGTQGGTDNLQSRGNVRQVHPASKWDRVSGQVPHSQQSSQPPLNQQENHRQASSKQGGALQVSSGKQAADCQTSRQAWYKDPKQECRVASLAPSSKERMFANVVSMSGDYKCTLPDEEAAINPCVTVKAAVTNHGVTEEKPVSNYRVTHIQEGGTSKG